MKAKERAFRKKVEELIRKANGMEDDAVARAVKILGDARKEIAARVAETEWQAWRIQELKGAVERSMQEFAQKYSLDLRAAQRSFWDHGIDLVDLPLQEAGVVAVLPQIDASILSIMQDFSTDLVKGLSQDAVKKIQKEITMGLLGQKQPFEVMKAIGRNLDDPSIFKSIAARAETITRTECGRVLEMSSQARREAFAEKVPGLKKEWRHASRVRMPRLTHVAADGQVRDVDKPFDVGGEKLMYPRDPAGSAANTINCGCYTVPYHENWETASVEERAAVNN